MAASTQRPDYKGTNVTWHAFGDGTSTGTKGSEAAQVRGWPLNCDVLPLNIKDASRFLRKWPSATLDIEPPEALWPETKGQAASLARGTGPSPAQRGRSRGKFQGRRWSPCRVSGEPRWEPPGRTTFRDFGLTLAEQRAKTSPRSRTDLNGSGYPHMELPIRRLGAHPIRRGQLAT
jgi:hypothetical protein